MRVFGYSENEVKGNMVFRMLNYATIRGW
jgi:hypothetical protein